MLIFSCCLCQDYFIQNISGAIGGALSVNKYTIILNIGLDFLLAIRLCTSPMVNEFFDSTNCLYSPPVVFMLPLAKHLHINFDPRVDLMVIRTKFKGSQFM
jgi:hypothetical protein